MMLHEPMTGSQRAKLTIDDFLTLSEKGAFAGYAKSELIEGEVWLVNAIHRRHARAHAAIVVEIGIALKAAKSALTLYANPSTELSDISLPEPDVAIAAAGDSKMIEGPTVRLAVEVSDSTLEMDLGRKARLYAKHGVPEYWVIDVEAEVVHQFWSTASGTYADHREVAYGATLTAATIDGLSIAAASF